jgi:hypothetical protein
MHAFAKPACRRVLAVLTFASLGGCATYRPLPLVSHPDLAQPVLFEHLAA